MPLAYRNRELLTSQLAQFKAAITDFAHDIDASKEEEYVKNATSELLKNTLYPSSHYHINIDSRTDLVIRLGSAKDDPIAVMMEFKRHANTAEMFSAKTPNVKALHELVWYYMQERENNFNVRHLIITDAYNWYVFDAKYFDDIFYKDTKFKKTFDAFKNKQLSSTKTEDFYKIVSDFVTNSDKALPYSYFNIINFKTQADYTAVYKFLHPQNLLKLSHINDSNALNQPFYDELLHILGLHEIKDGGLKRIVRKPTMEREEGSLIENTIRSLQTHNYRKRIVNVDTFGATETEQVESIALELCITWLNRILFMKLLEGQLKVYHHNDKRKADYAFMRYDRANSSDSAVRFDFDQLNQLFFEVFAVPQADRRDDAQRRFGHLPYLNSALFEPTDLENFGIYISALKDNLPIRIYHSTIVRNAQGQRETGISLPVKYLLDFLNSYDFAAERNKEGTIDRHTLINAAVLGLVFEKLNGYKDGAFFTPGFVTMYMCRETIRAAVIQKFNDTYHWNTATLDDINRLIIRHNIANDNALATLRSVKICDPAVGSGHFLVSALNELLIIQKELGLWADANGKPFRNYTFAIDNDELIIKYYDEYFLYDPYDEESARMQATLFHAKRAFIENSLFGVDINPKSVAICRLRLWIELLKNAYYAAPADTAEKGKPALVLTGTNAWQLQTLPNIDINIKTGNSLVSAFKLNFEVSKIKNLKARNIYLNKYNQYKIDVFAYKNCTNSNSKDVLRERMAVFYQYLNEIALTEDADHLKILEQQSLLMQITSGFSFEDPAKIDLINRETEKLEKLQNTFKQKRQEIFYNALEWRFVFPEVLDDNGKFVGFDAVIGNPPYIQLQAFQNNILEVYKKDYTSFTRTGDIYGLFFERAINLLKPDGHLHFIVSNKWMRASYGQSLRQMFLNYQPLQLIDFGSGVFDNATVDTNTLALQKTNYTHSFDALDMTKEKDKHNISLFNDKWITMNNLTGDSWIITSDINKQLITKIEQAGKPLKDWDVVINRGILTGYNEAFYY